MSLHVRVIVAGGSVSVGSCKLVALGPNSSITDQWDREFGAPADDPAEWGEGSAPTFSGTITADRDSQVYLRF